MSRYRQCATDGCRLQVHCTAKRIVCKDCFDRVNLSRKVGRKKKLSAEQAAVVFQLQCEQAALERQIGRILDAAGYHGSNSRSRILALNWIDRGRVDVMHPVNESIREARSRAGELVAKLRTAA